MKKIKHILVCGLAVVASAVAVQAQTLTQDWKMTTGLPSAAEARDGIGGKGKIWTNDKGHTVHRIDHKLEEKEKSGPMTRVLQN